MTTPASLPWAPDTGHAGGAAVTGIDGHLVDVRARITNGPDSLTITGLRGTQAESMGDRIRAAVINSGLAWPGRSITVTLTLPGLPGCGLDLPITIAILTAAGVIPAGLTAPCILIAEAGLDGSLRPVRGVLPAVTAASRAGATTAILAPGNAAEAVLVPGMSVVPCQSLRAVLTWLHAGRLSQHPAGTSPPSADPLLAAGLAASPTLLQALQACAAGGHHLLLTGARDAGLAELAPAIRTLLSPLNAAEAAQVTAIYSTAGLLPDTGELISEPPWRSPHHTLPLPAMLGGGSGIVRPGEVPLAHHGVLFLDQAPEFGRDILTALRQPLTIGQVTISRAGITTQLPARFTLIAAVSPCPCGGTPNCSCTRLQARRYASRVTSDLGNHFSIRVTARSHTTPGRSRPDPVLWAAHVADARDRARHRLRSTPLEAERRYSRDGAGSSLAARQSSSRGYHSCRPPRPDQ